MKTKFKHILPALIVTVTAFVTFACLILVYMNRSQEIWEKDERTRLIRLLNNKRSNLENELYARIYYTKSVAAYVSLRPDISAEEYYNLADELIQDDPIINTMSLAHQGIIDAVYPLKGHESVIGLNLLDHPKRKEIVEQTIATRKTFVAGPVELVEGGLAFISYTPIFDKTITPPYPFWGMTDIVIKKNELIEASGIREYDLRTRFAIRGYDGLGHHGDVFFGDPSIFEQNPVTVEAQLPDGKWVIAAIPTEGWAGYLDQDRILLIVLISSGLIISLLLGLFASAVNRIRRDAQQMSSIFKAMTGAVIELNTNEEIVWVAATQQQLPAPLDNLQPGNTLSEILPPLEETIRKQLQRTFKKQAITSFEFEIKSASDSRWMLATLSPNARGNLIMVIQEVTLQKQQQVELTKSESELKRLNANKDRLFSIIAHDLRTPLSAITGLSDQLLRHRDTLSPKEQQEFVELIFQSGKENLLLLENLLTWAQSQQDGLEVRREVLSLKELAVSSINTFRELATYKGIFLINQIETDVHVYFDRSMLETILRNLLSNAIKFSKPGSRIELGMRTVHADRSLPQSVEVFVKDYGVGMPMSVVNSILTSGNTTSSVGTADETGTGLGLPLCREFLEKHGQSLRITSQPGRGTTVFFTVAVAI